MSSETELLGRVRAVARPLQPRPTAEPARMERLRGIHAVCFDVYGTLLISGSGEVGTDGDDRNVRALAAAAQEVGLPLTEDECRQAAAAMREEIEQDHRQARAAGRPHPEVEIRDVWAAVGRRLHWRERLPTDQQDSVSGLSPGFLERFAMEYELRANPVWPMPNATAVLQELAAREILLGIVSNAQFYTPLILRALLEAPSLDQLGFRQELCLWSYRSRRAKPDPLIFEDATVRFAELGVPPEQILYVGNDMRNDVWAPQELGWRTALFAGDARSLRLRTEDPRAGQRQRIS